MRLIKAFVGAIKRVTPGYRVLGAAVAFTGLAAVTDAAPAYAQQTTVVDADSDVEYAPSAQVRRATVLASECMTDFCENTNGRDRRELVDGTRWNGVAVTQNGRIACSRLATSYGITLEEVGWDRPITECTNRITGRAIIDYLYQTHGFSSLQDLVGAGYGTIHNGVFTFALNKDQVIEVLRAFSTECQAAQTVEGTPNVITAYTAPAPLPEPAADLNPTVLLGDATGPVGAQLAPQIVVDPTDGDIASTATLEAPPGVNIIVGGQDVGSSWQGDPAAAQGATFLSRREGSGDGVITLTDCEQGRADNCETATDTGILTWNAAPREFDGRLYRVTTPGTPFSANTPVPFFSTDEGVDTGLFTAARPDGLEFDGNLALSQNGLDFGSAADLTYTNDRFQVTGGVRLSQQGPLNLQTLSEGVEDTVIPFGRASFDILDEGDLRLTAYGEAGLPLVSLAPANVPGSFNGSDTSARIADAVSTDPFAGVGARAEWSPNDGDTVVALDAAVGRTLSELGGDPVTLDTRSYICNNCGLEEEDALSSRVIGSVTQNFNLNGSPEDSYVSGYAGMFQDGGSRIRPDHISGPSEGNVYGASGRLSFGRFEVEGSHSALSADCATDCSRPSVVDATSTTAAANVVFHDTPLWGADLRVGPVWYNTRVSEAQDGAPGRGSALSVQGLGLRAEGSWDINPNTNFRLGLQVANETREQEFSRTSRAGISGASTYEEEDVNVTVGARLGLRF